MKVWSAIRRSANTAKIMMVTIMRMDHPTTSRMKNAIAIKTGRDGAQSGSTSKCVLITKDMRSVRNERMWEWTRRQASSG